MYAFRPNRALSALAAACLVGGMAALLMLGLRTGDIARSARSMVSVNFPASRPVPRPTPTPLPKTKQAAPKEDAGERNLKNQATQIVAERPRIVIVPPPPVAVATTPANTGNATQSGASDRSGPGQGAGDRGNGLGGGGTGGAGTGEAVVGPRRIRGRLSFDDVGEDLLPPGEEALVEVRYAVEIDGRVTGCRAIRQSGYPAIDALACRLIERRFVYRPARDRAGRPVRSMVEENHRWVVDEEREREN